MISQTDVDALNKNEINTSYKARELFDGMWLDQKSKDEYYTKHPFYTPLIKQRSNDPLPHIHHYPKHKHHFYNPMLHDSPTLYYLSITGAFIFLAISAVLLIYAFCCESKRNENGQDHSQNVVILEDMDTDTTQD